MNGQPCNVCPFILRDFAKLLRPIVSNGLRLKERPCIYIGSVSFNSGTDQRCLSGTALGAYRRAVRWLDEAAIAAVWDGVPV